ncbi:MAG: PKD domain-containing protein, partial [Nitrospinae bacterium]|nr:PKD domain-containing protein [Nitrospinota bacterium]
MSPTAPKKGDRVTLAAEADDPDPDDILTYLWRGVDSATGSTETMQGQVVSRVVNRGGTYRMTLLVADGHGGTDTASHSFTVDNAAPVIQSISATT